MELDDALKYSFLQFDPAPRRGEPHVTRRYTNNTLDSYILLTATLIIHKTATCCSQVR